VRDGYGKAQVVCCTTDCLTDVCQAVYFYQPDGRGPCLAFEGEKLQLHWYRGYMLIVSKENKPLPRG